MVKKKLLTLDDLVLFCQQNNFAKFSAKESGYQLAVQVPTTFEVEDSSDDSHRGMIKLKFRILHDGLNRNGSFVSRKAAEKAASTIADRPIMAAIHQLDDGSYDFEAHEMEIVESDNGNYEVNYIEKQVGSFSSEKPFWEHDDVLDKDYLCAYGYIAEEYTKAADIIREKGGTKNSCELTIEELAYNSKEKYLELQAFYLSASTLLGSKADGTEIQEGMLGSRADIVEFSEKNNSVLSDNNKVIELLSALNEKLDNLNINELSLKEGGNPVKKKFEKDSEVAETEVIETPSATFDGDGDADPDATDFYDDTEDGDGDTQDPNTETPINNGVDDPIPGGENPIVGDDDEGDDEEDGDDDPEPTPEDIAAAQAVTDEITALPDTITLDDADDVAAARAAYDALTDLQKSLVSAETLKELTDAEKAIEDLTSADAVIDMIDALPEECGLADVTAVTEAKNAYEALSADQKALVPDESVEKLNKAEEGAYGALGSTDDKPKKKTNSVEYSVKFGNINKSHFATLSEKLSALTDLVNITYGDVDGTWYSVDADEDAKMVYMHDWWCDKHFRQSYAVKKDVYTLKGDRVETFTRYLSQDEINQLEQLKSNYSYIEAKLQSYESEPDKLEILNKECYAKIANTEEFKELSKRETYFEMSTEDVQKKADEILLTYAKKTDFAFDSNDNKKVVGVKQFSNPSNKVTKRNRYGGLGKNKQQDQ